MKLPKLALRDLFWLVLICAMGCGWWVSYSRSLSAEKAARSAALKAKTDQDLAEDRLERLKSALHEQGMHVTFHDDGIMEIRYDGIDEQLQDERRHQLLEAAVREEGYNIEWVGDSPQLAKP